MSEAYTTNIILYSSISILLIEMAYNTEPLMKNNEQQFTNKHNLVNNM